MLTFCTLFDSHYLSRGLAMYNSLCRHCPKFHLYIFAFDDICYNFFQKYHFNNITAISLNEFEDEALLTAKSNRSLGEYCWTCTSSTILYVLNHYNVESCTYIDADLFFFSSPQVLIDEIGNNSVMITEHRYTEKYNQTETSGKYCVQFVYFKNNIQARTVLEWWRESCIKWCYNRVENGKFGDQKYLDDWCTRFGGVYELQHLGGGVAPWNMQQYNFIKKRGKLYGIEGKTSKHFKVVFFHFHALTFHSPIMFTLSSFYEINSKNIYKYLFTPYIIEILKVRRKFPHIAQKEKYDNKIKKLEHTSYEEWCCIWSYIKVKLYLNTFF